MRTPKVRTRASLDALRGHLTMALAAVENLDSESQALIAKHYSKSGFELADLIAKLKTAGKATRDALLQTEKRKNPDPDYYQEMLALDVAMVLRYILNIAPMTAGRNHNPRVGNSSAAIYARVLAKVVELAGADEIDLEKLTAAGLRRMDESGRTLPAN